MYLVFSFQLITAYNFSPNLVHGLLAFFLSLLYYGTLSYFVAERTAVCLHHDEHNEIFLYCKQGLIHILEAQHGHVVGNNASNCTYQQSDRCAVPLPNMEYLRDHCMGKGRCTVGVSPLFLDPCGRESNYMQVVYSCVSGE